MSKVNVSPAALALPLMFSLRVREAVASGVTLLEIFNTILSASKPPLV
jgi:hypothetical protein